MATAAEKMLRVALAHLRVEKDRIERQIRAVEGVLGADGGRGRRTRKSTKGMASATRKAIGRRMKAYWAKRKAKALSGTPKR